MVFADLAKQYSLSLPNSMQCFTSIGSTYKPRNPPATIPLLYAVLKRYCTKLFEVEVFASCTLKEALVKTAPLKKPHINMRIRTIKITGRNRYQDANKGTKEANSSKIAISQVLLNTHERILVQEAINSLRHFPSISPNIPDKVKNTK